MDDFGSGGTPGHQKAKATQGGPGGEGPLDGSEVWNFKTIQSIRKWIHFSKILTSFLPEKSIFSTKTFEKLNWFYKDFIIFSKDYFTHFNFYDSL